MTSKSVKLTKTFILQYKLSCDLLRKFEFVIYKNISNKNMRNRIKKRSTSHKPGGVSDLGVVEEPGHLDLALLHLVLQTALELQALTLLLDLQNFHF